MRKATVFTIITCLFVLLPLTTNSQLPSPHKKVPVRKPFTLVLPGHDSSYDFVSDLAFTRTGILLTVVKKPLAAPASGVFWDPFNVEDIRVFKLPEPAGLEVPGFSLRAFSANAQFFAVSDHKYIRLWNMFTGEHIRDITFGDSDFAWPVFSPNEKFLATSSPTGPIGLWDSRTGNHIRTFEDSHQGVPVFNPDGTVLATVAQKIEVSTFTHLIRVWATHTGERIRDITPSLNGFDSSSIKHLVFNPDGESFAIAVTRQRKARPARVTTIELWRLSGNLLHSLKLPIGQHTNDIVFSPDGRMIAAPITGTAVQLWDTNTGKLIRSLSPTGEYVSSVVFSPDGQWIVGVSSNSDAQAPLWNPHTGKLVALLAHGYEGKGSMLSNIIFSPDGKIVAGTSTMSEAPVWWEIPSRIGTIVVQ